MVLALKALCHDISGNYLDLVYGLALSKIAHIQNIVARSSWMPEPIERQGKDLATRRAARGLVSLSTFRPTLAR